MSEKPVWRGRDEIMYSVAIRSGDENTQIPGGPGMAGEGWKYHIYITGAGKYEEATLSGSGDSEAFLLLADTKEGIIRDLAKYIGWQLPSDNASRKDRQNVELPPLKMSPSNVEVFDGTDDHAFRDINIPEIFANATRLADAPIPVGEKPFIATVYDDEYNGKNLYRIGLSVMDPMVYEEFENPGQWAVDYDQFDEVPAPKVNKGIREYLTKQKIEQDIPIQAPGGVQNKMSGAPIQTPKVDAPRILVPNVNNTKIINYTDNPAFTLNNVFGVTQPLRIPRKAPVLQLAKKVEAPRMQEPKATLVIRKKAQKPSELAAAEEEVEKLDRLKA